MVSAPQPRNRLEDWRGENDKVSGRVWKTVEVNTEKVRIGETEGGRSKRRSRKKIRRERKEKERKEREDSRS